MEIKLKEALPFIVSKEPVLQGTVEYVNGAYVFTSKNGTFKQVLKKSEYDKLMEASSQGNRSSLRDSENVGEDDQEKSNQPRSPQRGRPPLTQGK